MLETELKLTEFTEQYIKNIYKGYKQLLSKSNKKEIETEIGRNVINKCRDIYRQAMSYGYGIHVFDIPENFYPYLKLSYLKQKKITYKDIIKMLFGKKGINMKGSTFISLGNNIIPKFIRVECRLVMKKIFMINLYENTSEYEFKPGITFNDILTKHNANYVYMILGDGKNKENGVLYKEKIRKDLIKNIWDALLDGDKYMGELRNKTVKQLGNLLTLNAQSINYFADMATQQITLLINNPDIKAHDKKKLKKLLTETNNIRDNLLNITKALFVSIGNKQRLAINTIKNYFLYEVLSQMGKLLENQLSKNALFIMQAISGIYKEMYYNGIYLLDDLNKAKGKKIRDVALQAYTLVFGLPYDGFGNTEFYLLNLSSTFDMRRIGE